jgi:DNA-binding CsgD family transcriptional regulator
MRQWATPVRRRPDPKPDDLRLNISELQQLRALLRDLLAPRVWGRSEQWSQSVLRGVQALTGSDKAILVVRTSKGPVAHGVGVSRDVISMYLNQFSSLDRSRMALQEHGVEAWSLDQLWPPGELERSEYIRSFAGPNGLHSTIGATLHLSNPRAEISLVLHKNWPESPAETARRLEMLGLLLEPMRAGFGMDLSATDQSSGLSSVMNVTGQALALYAMDGRELVQNPVMRRVLSQDPEREVVREHLRSVVKSVLASLDAQGPSGESGGHKLDGTRREVATSQAAYRLRGNLVGRNTCGHGTAVLVSLDRVAFEIPAPDSIRTRFGLTVRELQVASLLMHRLSNAEIARMLSISPHTARHHTENVLAKVGVRSREALRRAVLDAGSGQPPAPGGRS